MANAVVIAVGMTTADLVRGAQEAATATRQMATRMRENGAIAAQSFNGLGGAIQKFKSEQVQQNRLVGFYVREIVEVTGASKDASRVIGGLGSVLIEAAAGGMSFGLAFEAVKAAVLIIREVAKGAEDAIRGINQKFDELQAKVRAARLTEAQKTFEDALGTDQYKGLVGKGSEVAGEIVDVRNRLQALQAKGSAANEQERRQVGLLTSQLEALSQVYDKTARARDTLYNVAKARYDEAVNPRAGSGVGFGQTWATGVAANDPNASPLHGVGTSVYATEEAAKKAAEAYALQFRTTYVKEMETTAKTVGQSWFLWQFGGYGGGETSQYSPGVSKGEEAGLLSQFGGGGTGQGMGMPTTSGLTGSGYKAMQANLKKEQESLKASMATWAEYGETVGAVLGNLAAGTATWGQVLAQVLSQAIRDMAKWAMEAILKAAGVTAANTMEENSKVGPWGWIVGMGSAMAAFAFTQAFAGKIGSAAGGWELPSAGGPFPAVLHASEKVLPARTSRGFDRIIAAMESGAAGGGSPTIVNLSAIDGRSTAQWLERGGTDEIRRALQRDQRNGRGG